MSTYTQILYQIVFSTKNREHTLVKADRDNLYKYIWGILSNKTAICTASVAYAIISTLLPIYIPAFP